MKKSTIEAYNQLPKKSERVILTKNMVIRNAVNTAEEEPIVGDGSWIEFWEVASGKAIPERCPCCNSKMSRDEGNVHGTHIIKQVNISNSVLSGKAFDMTKELILPLCETCNGKHGQVLELAHLVSDISAVTPIQKESRDTSYGVSKINNGFSIEEISKIVMLDRCYPQIIFKEDSLCYKKYPKGLKLLYVYDFNPQICIDHLKNNIETLADFKIRAIDLGIDDNNNKVIDVINTCDINTIA